MQTESASPLLTIEEHPESFSGTAPADWSISMAIHVNADARRISQALTEPEYLEAWVSLPEQREDSFLVASLDENGFRLEHHCSGQVDTEIVGSYLYRHQRKMRLAWRRACHPAGHDSIVDFRVRGNFGSSVLELRHMDFCSEDEFHWHKLLWCHSLGKLSKLLQSS